MTGRSVPIVLVHGLATSTARTWGDTGWLDLLGDLGRPVVGLDLLGHATADPPLDPSAYDHLEDELFDRFPDGPVDAIGFSLGARTLLDLAGRHPERFRRLVVAGVGANLFRHDDHSELAEALDTGTDGHPVLGHFEQLARSSGTDPRAVAALLRRTGRPLTDDDLARITAPVLVVIGDRDFAGPGEPLAERLTDARLVTLRGVDHFATPKSFAFIDAALDFLA